jgi:hypothetical protein
LNVQSSNHLTATDETGGKATTTVNAKTIKVKAKK